MIIILLSCVSLVRQNASMCFFDDLDVQARTKKAYPDLKVNGHQYYRSDVIPSMADDIKQEIIKAELSHYRHNSDRPERSENIFAWWRKNKARFPLVAKGAKILLCVPATSVSSERTFSIAGLLYSNTLRNRMNATTAEMLILIKANLNKLKLAPTTVPDDEELQKHVLEIHDLENAE